MKTLRLLLLLLAGSASVASAQNPNFSNTTPAPPSGGANCLWQHDASTPVNISCYIPSGTYDAANAASAALTAAETFATAAVSTEHTAMLAAVAASGSGSAHVKYVSTIAGVTSLPYLDCAPGASATGLADSWSALNAYTSAGGYDLEYDGCFALSAALNVTSSTTNHGAFRGAGVIMLPASNSPAFQNTHITTPTTASGTTGFVVSNQTDSNISLTGLVINCNSTQAVTGTNASGTAHGATPGGLFVPCVNLVGVNTLDVSSNEAYDSGAFNLFFSNDSNGTVSYNYVHAPLPMVAAKFTDCLHWTGPNTNFSGTGNILTCGDDSLAFNADDGNYPGSGDANSSYIPSYVKYGPITNMHFSDTTLLSSNDGIRVLSQTNLIDDITLQNTTGNICGIFGSLYPAYSTGTGNYGSVKIDGVSVTDSWTCPTASFTHYFIMAGGSFHGLQISHLNYSNPGQPYPVFYQYAAAPTGSTRLSDWTINTQTSTVGSIVNTGTNPGQLSLSGLSWNDALGTGSVFAGATVPTLLTCSNYSGPNLLLAGGYSPSLQNGDCFTNSYTAVTTYISTPFNEGSSGSALAGTAPATLTNGATGTWSTVTGGFTFNSGGGITSTAIMAAPQVINTGVTNEVIRFNLTACSGGSGPCALAVRYTNSTNFIAVNLTPTTGAVAIYDVVSGTATAIGTGFTGASVLGNYTVTLNGTHITVANAYGTTSAATTANTGTFFGFQNDNSGITMTVGTMSARNQ